MAELPSPPPQSLPPKPESGTPPSQPDPQPQSTPPAPSAATPPPPAGLNPSPNVNPPPALLPTSVPIFPPPAVSGVASSLQPPVHMFRPPVPQFSPMPGAVSYQNSAVTSAPGMAPPAPGSMMQYQVPVPGQPPNQLFRPFAPNGYAVMPPPGLPSYTAQYTTMARPMFPPRPPGALGLLPTIPRPPFPLIPGVRPVLHPIIRPGGLVPITPAEKPQTTVYVGKIAPSVSNEVMLSLLQFCGPVKSWKRLQDPTDGTLKRFGLCEFDSAEGVLRALRLLNKLNLDGQELSLKFNEATKGYLLRYIERKTENAKKLKESETALAEKEGEDAASTEKNESLKVGGDETKKDGTELGKGDESNSSKADDSDSGKKDDVEQVKKDEDYSDFGLVTDEDREADRVAMEKISEIIEERLKSLPPPPPLTDGLRNASLEMPAKSRDGDSDVKNDAEDKIDEETTSDNKTTSDHDKTDVSAADRNRRYDNRRNRDRDRDVKGDRERELDRHERDAERERIRLERELRRKIEDAEREYERRLKDWEAREREREKARLREKEKERDKERKRKKEILLDEEEDEEDSRRWNRSVLEDKRKKRLREKEDDLADRIKEEEEIAEAKKRAEEEEKLRELEQDKGQHGSAGAVTENKKQSTTDVEMAESKDRAVHPPTRDDSNYAGKEGTSQIGSIDDSTTSTLGVASDTQSNNAPAKKLGFGLSGSGKRTAVLSVFHEDEDDDAHKDKKMRPLVPIDYTTEEMQAIQSPQAEAPPQPNLAAAAEYAKRISSGKEKPEMERERSRRSHDRSSHRDRDRYDEDGSRSTKEKTVDREKDRQNGSDKSKTPDNKKLLDAKQLIDMIPKTKEDLFSYEINWALYDEHKLHERMRPWISKKITEFLGEEEKVLVDYIVSSTQEHVKASEMLETLENILDEEAEMFLLKMWRMLIFEIKKVETGLPSRSRT